MTTYEIVLVRHATTADTRAGLLSGHGPTPLDEPGRTQARAIGTRLAGRSFDRILVSPVARAWETAVLAGLADGSDDASGGRTGVEADEALVEWRYGDLVGRRASAVREVDPTWALWTHGAPGGEQPDEIASRVAGVVTRLHAADGDVVVVSHGHVLRALIVTWLGLPVASAGGLVIDPASISVLGHRHGRPALVCLNDRSHLSATET